jgi:hypothetical protein
MRLLALRTGHTFTPRNIPGTLFCWRLTGLQGHSAAGRIRSIKNPNVLTGNWTLDLPTCSVVPQAPMLPRALPLTGNFLKCERPKNKHMKWVWESRYNSMCAEKMVKSSNKHIISIKTKAGIDWPLKYNSYKTCTDLSKTLNHLHVS